LERGAPTTSTALVRPAKVVGGQPFIDIPLQLLNGAEGRAPENRDLPQDHEIR
jgi:hypothetical protein